VRSDGAVRVWQRWDPNGSQLGSVLLAVPDVAAADGPRVVGLVERGVDGGTTLDVVAADLETGVPSFVATDVLAGSSFVTAQIAVP